MITKEPGFGQKYILGPTTKPDILGNGIIIQFNDLSQQWIVMGISHQVTPTIISRDEDETWEEYKKDAYRFANDMVYFNKHNSNKDKEVFKIIYNKAVKDFKSSKYEGDNIKEEFQKFIDLHYKNYLT